MSTGSDEVLATEQVQLDRIYVEAERLAERLDRAAPVADAHAGRAVHDGRQKRLSELLSALEDHRQLLAFGRLDLCDGAHRGRTVYLGRALVGDPDDDYPLLISWRSELASAFYNPLGFEDGTSVELKRSLIGSHRRIESFLDERPLELVARRRAKAEATTTAPDVARPQERRRPPERIRRTAPRRETPTERPPVPTRPGRSPEPVHRTEEVLPAPRPARAPVPVAPAPAAGPRVVDPLVDRLRARSGTGLDAIIETIQARQYELMERPLDRTLVIQGGPGTGKTVIALHRVAVQLFRSRGALAENDILFVGPSRTFIGYVDKVLPGLGERQVVHRAIEDLASHDVFPTSHDPSDVALVKGLPQMSDVIDRFLRARTRLPAREVELGPGVLAAVPPGALEPILARARTEARDYGGLRTHFRRLLSDERVQQDLIAAATPDSTPSVTRTPPRIDPRRADALARVVVPTVSPREAIHGLLTSPDLLEAAADDLLTAAQQATIRRRADNIQQHPWTFEDLQLLDEAAAQLGPDRRPQRYAHVVVDEAQDFSAMQLRMIRRRTSGSLTILGDLAQATTGWRPETWDEHLGSAGIEADDLEELTDSYRTTAPILDTANRLLDVIDLGLEPPQSVIEDGDEVLIEQLDDPGDDAAVLARHIGDIRTRARSGDTIGVIGPLATLVRIEPELRPAGLAVAWVTDDVAAPIVLVPVDAAKGLEYDHVIIVEPERIHRSDAATGPRKLYVAMTRARASLRLLHRDRLPRVLVEPDPDAEPSDDHPAAVVPDIAAAADADASAEASVAPLPRRLQRRAGPDLDIADVTGAAPAPGPRQVPTGRGTVVLTDHPGIDRRDLIIQAERLGFAVRPDIGPETTLLVVGRLDSTSRRARLARQAGVPLATAAVLLATAPGGEIGAELQAPER